MSFGNFARKVRDPALPHQHRVSALRSCVQLYRPIGFHATLSFLQHEAGPFQRNEAALLDALDMLQASRNAWHTEIRAYAAARRAAKRRGQRTPLPAEVNPYTPTHWYGAPRPAGLHALRFWHQQRLTPPLSTSDQIGQDISHCVTAFQESGGRLTATQHQLLASCVDELVPHLSFDAWREDPARCNRSADLLKTVRLLQASATDERPDTSAT
ncbi:hypothetical protein ACFORO_19825 [Amycolatopsis halotolerans]|uniref:Transcriptional regulator n=1 Tax=Amycolatopsis halotolerans TaxID=330083 RepID=A0ABV7QGI2_9PSEU